MLTIDKIKGIIFDYGGTIDSNGLHWAEGLRNLSGIRRKSRLPKRFRLWRTDFRKESTGQTRTYVPRYAAYQD